MERLKVGGMYDRPSERDILVSLACLRELRMIQSHGKMEVCDVTS